MTSPYEPRPGTVAFRVLAHLATLPAGAEVLTSALAEPIGQPTSSVVPCLEPALAAGKLFKRQRDAHVRSPYWWSLADHATAGAPPPQRGPVCVLQKDQRGVAQLVARRAHNPEVGGSSPPPAPLAEEPGPQQVLKAEGAAGGLRIALWSDGTLQINRAPAADGAVRVLQFNEAETRQLVAYLDRVLLDGMEGRTK
jgi:hypothetical protein